MSITIEKIKEAFEVGLSGDSSPLNYNKDGNIENPTEDTKIQASSISSWRAEISFKSTEIELLVLNLPTICKMLLDATAEIERLKAEKADTPPDWEHEKKSLLKEISDMQWEINDLKQELLNMSYRNKF